MRAVLCLPRMICLVPSLVVPKPRSGLSRVHAHDVIAPDKRSAGSDSIVNRDRDTIDCVPQSIRRCLYIAAPITLRRRAGKSVLKGLGAEAVGTRGVVSRSLALAASWHV
jgi:hypothetical protein